jgi:xanthine dehydrogenase accessory factor
MIRQDLSDRSAALRASRVPFVHARVVLAERPTSAKPGDEAIVFADGAMEGFVGGGCAVVTVRHESLEVLASGQTVLLRVTPEPEPSQPGKRVVHNPCLSGGTFEVFLEPVLPPPLIRVVGDAPTAASLLAMGRFLGYAMAPFDGSVEPDAAAVVVASHGRGEEGALVAALEAGVPYVGLVASRKRGSAVVAALPVSSELKARVHTPAGLDIGASTAEEVALSILAEIVASHPRQLRPPAASQVAASPVAAGQAAGAAGSTEIDPVCGMSVLVGEDSLHTVHADPEQNRRVVWFCGPGCRQAFLANPAAYPVSVGR